jgi:hypothetical protein
MKLERTIPISNSAQARERIVAYFKAAGYRQRSESPLTFERGSLLGTFFGFSPSAWHVKTTINITNDLVLADFDINTTGQLVRDNMRAFWQAEMLALHKAIDEGVIDSALADKADQMVWTENVILLSLVLVLFVIFVFIAIFLFRSLPTATDDTVLTSALRFL